MEKNAIGLFSPAGIFFATIQLTVPLAYIYIVLLLPADHDALSLHDTLSHPWRVDSKEDEERFAIGTLRRIMGHARRTLLCMFGIASQMVEFVGYIGIIVEECADVGGMGEGGAMGFYDGE